MKAFRHILKMNLVLLTFFLSSTEAATTIQVEQKKTVDFFEARDPETQELIRFQFQPASRETLLKSSPSKIRKEIQLLKPNVPEGGFVQASAKLGKDFIPEYIAFTMAMAISQSLHTQNDPVFLKNFAEENFSVLGAGSFLGFMAGARGTHAFLQAVGLSYDPRRAAIAGYNYQINTPLINNSTSVVLNAVGEPVDLRLQNDYLRSRIVGAPILSAPTNLQRRFAPLAGPMGLWGGMLVSNVIHEIVADINLQACAKATMLGNSPEAVEKIDEACDRAWEDWAFSKKMADYGPDMLAMAGAALAQAYFANRVISGVYNRVLKPMPTALAQTLGVETFKNTTTGKIQARAIKTGAERYIPVVLRSFELGKFVTGKFTPFGRVAMTAGNILVFMELVHPITPLLKKPFERRRQGQDITERINTIHDEIDRAEKLNWAWSPRTDSDFCGDSYMPDHVGCNAVQNDPVHLLKKMAERQAKWREFILADAYAEHAKWQKYVADFSIMYANAVKFYSAILSHLNYQKFSPLAQTEPTSLFTTSPFNGLYTDAKVRDGGTAREAIDQAREWLETYIEGQQLKRRSSGARILPTERDVLPEILHGLRAIDTQISLAALHAPEAEYLRNRSITVNQIKEIELRVRGRMFENAMRKLRSVLATDIVFNDRNVPLNSPTYKRLAEKNPFMALRMRLGDPEPLSVGVATVRELNDIPSIIEQESKFNHPGGIGRVRTKSMTDYLIASMVCGPEANPQFSDAEKIRIFQNQKGFRFERVLRGLGLGTRAIKADDADVMIAVQEEVDSLTRPNKSLISNSRTKVTSSEWAGISADFRPPRIVTGVPASICSKFADNSDRDQSSYDGYEAKWTIDGITYNGLLDIIRKKTRPELVGTGLPPRDSSVAWTNPFDTWWSAHVEKHVAEMVIKFRSSFRVILEKNFLPALTGSNSDKSIEYNGRDFKLGALPALYDEAQLYLDLLARSSQIGKFPQKKKAYVDFSQGIVLSLKNIGELVSDLRQVEANASTSRALFELRSKALMIQIDGLTKIVSENSSSLRLSEENRRLNEQLLANLNGLIGEMNSYWGVIRSIQVSEDL